MKTKTRRKNMKGCGSKGCSSKGCGSKGCNKCTKSKCSHTRRMKGGCGTCQSGGNIYAPTSSILGTAMFAAENVFRAFQGLIPL